jgi:hypothetical protein
MSAETCSYEFWLGPRELKYSSPGVERSVKPNATIRRARAVFDTIGVTKVADVTDLDRVGIPNFMTVRPHDRGPGISYYNGKGTTRADAYAGARRHVMDMTLLRPSTLKDISILSSGRSIGTTAGYDGFGRARTTRSVISSISPVAPSKAAMIKDVMVRLDGTSADDVRLAAANLIAETFESHIWAVLRRWRQSSHQTAGPRQGGRRRYRSHGV